MSYSVVLLDHTDIAKLLPSEKKPPPHVTGACKKCGSCCRAVGCPAVHPKTNLCMVQLCKPVGCRVFPSAKDAITSCNCPGYKYHYPKTM